MRLTQLLLEILFPSRCVGCGRRGASFCPACLSAISHVPPNLCFRCGEPGANPASGLCARCRRSETALDGGFSVGYSAGALRQAIHRLKYDGQSRLAEPLASLLTDWWAGRRLTVDLIVPVPLHPARQRDRGYNQSALLARRLAAHTALPCSEDAVLRCRNTRPQVGLGAAERWQNVDGAFRAEPTLVAGLRVLLLDDVRTTGSTLEASARALRDAGAATVWALTVARARRDAGHDDT